jgi:peptidoglycan/LPS O-acetylase OafA/YrhL
VLLLGRCSYSLYLMHVPVVGLVSRFLVAPLAATRATAFGMTVAIAVPASVLTAALFAALFEDPFRSPENQVDTAPGHRADGRRRAGPPGSEGDPMPAGGAPAPRSGPPAQS